MLTLAQLPMWAISLSVVFYVLISVILVLAVLIQRPQGGGLSTAFGAGAGSGQTAFGTKIGDALTIFTIVVFTLFIGASIGLVYLLRPSSTPAEQPSVTAPEGTTGGTGDSTGTPADGTNPVAPAGGQTPGDQLPGTTPPDAPTANPEQPATPPVEPTTAPSTPPTGPG